MRRGLLIALCTVCTPWLSALAQTPVGFLANPSELNVGTTPLGVAAGDFDGNGIPDLCTANADSANVSILLGRGNGTFDDTLPRPTVETVPVAVATGDLDGDGKIDIVAVDDFDNTLNALLNQGGGTFAPAIVTTTGASPEGVVLGKFDADAILDAATANFDAATVSVLKGAGDGHFTVSDEVPVGDSPVGVAADDLDKDGKPDLVVTNSAGGDDFTGTVSVLRNAGDGTFEALPEILVSCGADDCTPVAVGIGDFNGDGNLDFAVANEYADTVTIFRGDGHLNFTRGAIVPTGSAPESLVVADFNGDGKLDIATTSNFQDNVAVLLGKGDGAFLPQPSTTVATAAAAGAITVALTDASRFPDRGVVEITPVDRLQYNRKAGNVLTLAVPLSQDVAAQAAAALVFPTDTSPWGLATADFNGDGKADLAATNMDAEDVSVLLNISGPVSTCVGDCKDSGAVTVDNLVAMVNIANDVAPIADCLAGDANGDGTITIDDIIIAVNNALNACPAV